MLNIKKILLPVDFSEFSKIAAPYAVDLARKFEADLFIIHVFDENILDPYYFGEDDYAEKYFMNLQKEFQEKIDDILEDIETEDINIIPILANGAPFIEILKFTKKEKIDMMVVSTHGRSGLSQMFMGSTAEKVVRKSPCPVLSVRHPEFEFEMP
ncbi:MAG: universal stress protein [Candidatus Zixiibacteriota bacterium]